MLCDKRDHLVGKKILDNYLIKKKLDENWLVKICSCLDLKSNKEYVVKLVRKIYLNNTKNRKEDSLKIVL